MNHPSQAARYVADQERAHWHDNVIWFMREKRDQAVNVIPEWEELRELGARIKGHTLSRLDDYLERFESQAKQLGVQIHWALDAEEHNQIVAGILQAAGARKVVKSNTVHYVRTSPFALAVQGLPPRARLRQTATPMLAAATPVQQP